MLKKKVCGLNHKNGKRFLMLLSSTVFLAAVTMAMTFCLFLYDSAQTDRSLVWLSAGTLADSIVTSTMEELRPLKLPTLADTAVAFAWLSLSEISLHPTALPVSPTSSTVRGRSIGWPALTQRLAAKGLTQKRLTIGWVLDTGTASIDQTMAQSPGLSVIAPKWLHIDGPNGALAGGIEPGVVQRAKQLGVRVWAVVDNGFNGVLCHELLAYRDRQDRLVRNIVAMAVRSHISGINIDFEGLLGIDRWNFTRFITVLAAQLHARHMVLSVDLPPDLVYGNNDGPYNHAAIAKAADYVILMGYDQHWGGDAIAGPTASLPWIKTGVADMLHTGVPARKLILGVPFYAQNWSVNHAGVAVNSQALSLIQLNQLLANRHTLGQWNAQLGVHYISYTSNGVRHEIWLEDNRSLLLSLQLIGKDGLAGAAAWYLGLESPSTWYSLVQSVHSLIA